MRKIYTILTEVGPLYTAFHSECDFFITPAHSDIECAAAVFEWSPDFAWANTMQYVLDMRPAALDLMECLVADLEEGHTLSPRDALVLSQMDDFFRGTIAPHQRSFDSLPDELLECWIQELGLRAGEMKDWGIYAIIGDGALWPAIHAPCLSMKYPDSDYIAGLKEEEASKEANMLAGRYLRSLTTVSKLFGPDRMTPEAIINEWSQKNCEYADSRPSMLDLVAELLVADGWSVQRNVQISSPPSQ